MKARRSLTPGQKHRVLARQDGKCAECGERLGERVEFDHRLALSLGGSNSIDNFEALCPRPCHLKRTHQTVKAKSKADRCAAYQETGHGYQHKRKPWSWLTFGGRRKQSGGAK